MAPRPDVPDPSRGGAGGGTVDKRQVAQVRVTTERTVGDKVMELSKRLGTL